VIFLKIGDNTLVGLGRRRRKVIRVVKRTLPKVFGCPNCGVTAVKVHVVEASKAKISCGNCKLTLDYEFTGRKEVIDIYNEFVDQFMAGKIKSEQKV
jgi:transcription elongation factor Elf1